MRAKLTAIVTVTLAHREIATVEREARKLGGTWQSMGSKDTPSGVVFEIVYVFQAYESAQRFQTSLEFPGPPV